MCTDDRSRREWLWLRAREKERAGPGLRERLRAIDAELGALASDRERREAYGRLLDLRTVRLESVACRRRACADTS